MTLNRQYLKKRVIKLDLEIDGSQHYTKAAIIHDKIRDKYLKQNGWTIYRINWKKMCNNYVKEINKFLKFYKLFARGSNA